MIYVEYPTSGHRHRKGQLSFHVKGDKRFSCRMRILKTSKKALPKLAVKNKTDKISGKKIKDGHLEYIIMNTKQTDQLKLNLNEVKRRVAL